ncbi:MAG: ferritin family protein [Dehalococcoidia bacterium]|nr:ferritin family protein [Dehalococcoidia bacterium]
MSISFSGSELINIAIGIEGRGIAFYDIMARSTENAVARDLFQYLADMERQHIQIFQGMLGEADKFQPRETYAGEYAPYLQALVESAVFTDDLVTSEMATKAASDIEALELAIDAEKDSILFYYEMRDIMPLPVQPTVNKIIAEEKSHLRQLSELKKKLTAQ